MKLTINGEEREFGGTLSGAQLLAQLDIRPTTVVVELNREVVPRDEFLQRELAEGDVLELVTIVGGG